MYTGATQIVENRTSNFGYLCHPKSGQFVGISTPNNGSGNLGLVQNRLIAFPFSFYRDAQITEIHLTCSTLQASAVLRLGFYNSDADGLPNSLISEIGTIDCSTTGQKSITSLALNFVGGVIYHFAFVLQGTASVPQFNNAKVTNFPNHPTTTANFTTAFYGAITSDTISGALPSTFIWVQGYGAASPLPPAVVAKIA